jgi:hypothetical protein
MKVVLILTERSFIFEKASDSGLYQQVWKYEIGTEKILSWRY